MTIKTKTALILCGLVLSFVVLESGLRICSFIFLARKNIDNANALKQKNSFRILCLGESTTAMGGEHSYPSQLQKILDQRSGGGKFSVINMGVGGITTSNIVRQIEELPAGCRPDMVLAMIGINDSLDYMPYQKFQQDNAGAFWMQFKIYKLVNLLRLRALAQIRRNKDPRAQLPVRRGLTKSHSPSHGDVALGWDLNKRKDYPQAEQAFLKALAANRGNYEAYLGLGWCYKNEVKFDLAEDSFKKAIAIDPAGSEGYRGLGFVYKDQVKYDQAEEFFKKAIQLGPENDAAYEGLGWCYRDQGRNIEAEKVFKRAIEINPGNDGAYSGLGWAYRDLGRFDEYAWAFKKAMELNPRRDWAYLETGFQLRNSGKYAEAVKILRMTIDENPDSDLSYGALATIYGEMGRFDEAQDCYRRANDIRCAYCNPVTVLNYRKLKGLLAGRGIKLVCVQYPVRGIAQLKKIFPGPDEGVVFVDNEKIFKDAIAVSGYKDYFTDMFGGDFGHCTPKGNKLLAENIAGVILKELRVK